MLEPARLEERDEVVAAAAAALADAGRGSGRLVVIEGPAGIGKSSLLDVIAARAGEARVLRARAHEIESRFVLGVTRQLFEPLLAAAWPEERERWLAGPPRWPRRCSKEARESPTCSRCSTACTGWWRTWLLMS